MKIKQIENRDVKKATCTCLPVGVKKPGCGSLYTNSEGRVYYVEPGIVWIVMRLVGKRWERCS